MVVQYKFRQLEAMSIDRDWHLPGSDSPLSPLPPDVTRSMTISEV
jgi:hypothetical protein